MLSALRKEFPDITISKIRFLESQGLIDPERTPSGYRRFYTPDLERLRWILLQQRDHFLPLRVIKDRLDEFGAEGPPADETPTRDRPARRRRGASPVRRGDRDHRGGSRRRRHDRHAGRAASEGELTRAELLEASGLTEAQLDDLEDHGLLVPVVGAGERAVYGEDALDIATLAVGFHSRGIEARHLKMYKHFSEREAVLFAQVLLPYLRQRNPGARARLVEELEELARLGRRLRTAMLRNALRAELAE